MRLISLTLASLVAAIVGCGDGSATDAVGGRAGDSRAGGESGISATLPSGWYEIERPVPNIIEPRPVLAAGTMPEQDWRWIDRGCLALRDIPAGEVLVSVIEYTKQRADFPRGGPPARYSAGRSGNYECSGRGHMFVFRIAGRDLQAHIAMRPGTVAARTRAEALALLRSIRATSQG